MSNACILFLVDESDLLRQRIVEGSRSKMEGICTALNSTLRQMEGGSPLDVAVVGYHLGADGQNHIGSRWGGAFAGKTWVSTAELLRNPLRVENRSRQVVDPGTRQMRMENVEFPVWVEPKEFGGPMPWIYAYDYVADQLLAWCGENRPVAPPLVISFLRDFATDESLAQAVTPLGKVQTPLGYPVLFQFHPGTYAHVPAIKYPSSANFLPLGPVQEMFHSCSPLSEPMLQTLRQHQEVPLPGAKGLVYNGRTIDLLRFMNLVKCYQAGLPASEVPSVPVSMPVSPMPAPSIPVPSMPSPLAPVAPLGGEEIAEPVAEAADVTEAAETASVAEPVASVEVPEGYQFRCVALAENKPLKEPELGPRQILLVLVMDRSVSDLTYRPAKDAWSRRLDKMRFMLGELARRGRGRYDVATVFYGAEEGGVTRVFSGSLGALYAADSALVAAAGKVEPCTIQLPNGIGGLISLPRKKLWFTDVNETLAADPVPAFAEVGNIFRQWVVARPEKVLQPLVLHITAGQFQPNRLDEAVGLLRGLEIPSWLHHWVFTERPHKGVCCPGALEFAEADPKLAYLWEHSDLLPGREILAGVRPGIHDRSRGIMVNMDFDILFEVIDTMASRAGMEGKP
ncbi:MAG: hypothetical protein Q4D98_09880 [Planctomycetia bacterium]|nr:hypothetical protein [Planctomycetia bacterium]